MMIVLDDIIAQFSITKEDWPDTEKWLKSIGAEKLDDSAWLAHKFLFTRDEVLEWVAKNSKVTDN